jgi:hypothetical protein
MFEGGETVGYHRSLAGTYGFQAGMQWSSTRALLHERRRPRPWEIGTGPSFAIVDPRGQRHCLTHDVYGYKARRVSWRGSGSRGRRSPGSAWK